MTSKQFKQMSEEAIEVADDPAGDEVGGKPAMPVAAKPERATRVRPVSKASAEGEADAVAPSTTVAPLRAPAGADPRGKQAGQPASAATAHALRAHKLQMLMMQLASTAWNNQVGTLNLPWHMNMQDWQELVAIQQAVLARCEQQYKQWVEGCVEIAQDYSQLRASNTLSKLVDHESNIVTQYQSLLSSQMSNWVGLVENIHVDYAYWLSQKHSPILGKDTGQA